MQTFYKQTLFKTKSLTNGGIYTALKTSNKMEIAKFIHGKNAVIHETKDGKNVVRLENAKHDNIIFYRGESLQRAQRMYKDLCLTIEKNIL